MSCLVIILIAPQLPHEQRERQDLIQSIWVKNLGPFDDRENRVDLAPLTILVGPNNSGKSMVIAGFNLLRSMLFRGGGFQWVSESYNLGDFPTAVHKHEQSRSIEVGAWVGSIKVYSLIRGGSFMGVSYDPPHRGSEASEALRSTWYFRASRSEVSNQREVGSGVSLPPWGQPLDPSGTNIITYLLERWTDQDPLWGVAQQWLGKVDPELSILKSPLRGSLASLVTTNKFSDVDVNVAYQGTGLQKVLTIMAAVIFSPKGSTIIIEEPEVHLHKDSQEVLADLFNFAVKEMGKQVIFSTHSWDMILPYISDIAKDMRKRGAGAVPIDSAKFGVQEFTRKEGKISIQEYPLKDKGFKDAATHFGQLLG